jgi:hypothetical protein
MTTKVTIHTKQDQVELFFNNKSTAEKFLQQIKGQATFMGSWTTHTANEEVQKKPSKKEAE